MAFHSTATVPCGVVTFMAVGGSGAPRVITLPGQDAALAQAHAHARTMWREAKRFGLSWVSGGASGLGSDGVKDAGRGEVWWQGVPS